METQECRRTWGTVVGYIQGIGREKRLNTLAFIGVGYRTGGV